MKQLHTLQEYTDRAQSLTDDELVNALRDIADTLILWDSADMSDPYVKKLWDERDAYRTEREIRAQTAKIDRWRASGMTAKERRAELYTAHHGRPERVIRQMSVDISQHEKWERTQ
jgi:hypothetical protein